MFNILFVSALIIFLLGGLYKSSNWFIRKMGVFGTAITPTQRLLAAAGGIVGVIFSAKIITLFRALLLDVFLQRRVLKENGVRWLAHMLIFYGFILLLLMHALEAVVSEALFKDYYSTVNPFFFLRDFFGTMVLVGVVIVIFRRYISKPQRLRSSGRDHYAIGILAIIMLSGLALLGLKITSYGEFQMMVEDYAGLDDEDEIQALETLWVRHYGLVSPNIEEPFDEDLLEAGLEVHASSCVDCHASAQSAFAGFTVAKILKPAAIWLDQAGGVTILWYVHIIACFAGLAYLPFSKMFHILVTPLSLITDQVMDPKYASPANILTRQIMELDACTHCGSCSLHCSAAMIYEAFGNEYILPSEKMTFLKKMIYGRKLSDQQMHLIQEGVYLCTNCDRCTVHCPSGIHLKELWYTVREQLLLCSPPPAAILSPFSFARSLVIQDKLAPDEYARPIEKASRTVAEEFADQMNPEASVPLNTPAEQTPLPMIVDHTFRHCFGCQSCTSVCPVVANFDDPERILGLLPHQIMYCLALGLTEMASGASMIWDCLTCYKCQENCPQQVEVCDLLFDLKNMAVTRSG